LLITRALSAKVSSIKINEELKELRFFEIREVSKAIGRGTQY
jgi:hypothetical protein